MKQKRQAGFSAIEIIIGVVIVGIIGLLGWKLVTTLQGNSQKNDVATTSKTSEITSDLTGLTDLETIQKSALDGKDGATITGIELKNEDGKLVYQATLSDGTVRTFDATSGAKLSEESEKADDTAKALPANFHGFIGLSKAVEVAKSAMPGLILSKVEIENDGGTLLYRITYTNESRVDVNATTGAVISKKDEGAKHKSEKAKEHSTTPNDDNETTTGEDSHSTTSSDSKETTTSSQTKSDDSSSGSDSSHEEDGSHN